MFTMIDNVEETCVDSGVYAIVNKKNSKFYIGSSSDIKQRHKMHLWALRGNYHENKKLQRAFNKYGEQNFILKILEICNEKLIEKEQYWMNLTECVKKGYNINTQAEKPPSWKGKKHSIKTKIKIGKKHKGKKISDEQKKSAKFQAFY